MEPAYEVETQTPGLGEGALEEARDLIGVELRRDTHQWNQFSDPDNVRHFCWGIGDSNPLFTDRRYGQESPWGTPLAPGCFLYTIDTTIVAPRLRGIQWIYLGTEWEWFREIPHRTEVDSRVELTDAVEKSGTKVERFIIQTGTCTYLDASSGEKIAQAKGSTGRIPRGRAAGGLKYDAREPHSYTSDEILDIEKQALSQVPRGDTPLRIEDVHEGQSVPSLVKGPLNIVDMICWYSTGHTYEAHERDIRHRRRHPADAFKNPKTGGEEHPARGHLEGFMAQEVGMPGVYDVALQRISWAGQMLHNWMGDSGFLRKLKVDIRRPNVLGDTTWWSGRVKRVWHGQDPEYRGSLEMGGGVVIEVKAENQLGDVTAEGEATVLLPT